MVRRTRSATVSPSTGVEKLERNARGLEASNFVGSLQHSSGALSGCQ